MNKEKLKILIIDDHPIIIDGYKMILESLTDYSIIIKSANNCDEAIRELNKSKNSKNFDIALVDIQIPSSSNKQFLNGEDIAVFIRENFQLTKIVFITMINDSKRLENILNNISHESVLIKSDITSRILLDAINNVIDGNKFYSKTLQNFNTLIKNEQVLDSIDRKILYFLANGVSTKNLTKYIFKSLSTIEKRKKKIKQIWEIEEFDDEKLIFEAKKRGYL